jgi:hypothetical protein
MKGVPGVIAFESQESWVFSSSKTLPMARMTLLEQNIASRTGRHTFPKRNGFFPCFFLLLRFPRRTKATGTLLVHFGARSNTVLFLLSSISLLISEHDLPIAINNNLRGRIMLTTLSVYLKISIIISSSVSGAGCI